MISNRKRFNGLKEEGDEDHECIQFNEHIFEGRIRTLKRRKSLSVTSSQIVGLQNVLEVLSSSTYYNPI
jgi:hypothetical protein